MSSEMSFTLGDDVDYDNYEAFDSLLEDSDAAMARLNSADAENVSALLHIERQLNEACVAEKVASSSPAQRFSDEDFLGQPSRGAGEESPLARTSNNLTNRQRWRSFLLSNDLSVSDSSSPGRVLRAAVLALQQSRKDSELTPGAPGLLESQTTTANAALLKFADFVVDRIAAPLEDASKDVHLLVTSGAEASKLIALLTNYSKKHAEQVVPYLVAKKHVVPIVLTALETFNSSACSAANCSNLRLMNAAGHLLVMIAHHAPGAIDKQAVVRLILYDTAERNWRCEQSTDTASPKDAAVDSVTTLPEGRSFVADPSVAPPSALRVEWVPTLLSLVCVANPAVFLSDEVSGIAKTLAERVLSALEMWCEDASESSISLKGEDAAFKKAVISPLVTQSLAAPMLAKVAELSCVAYVVSSVANAFSVLTDPDVVCDDVSTAAGYELLLHSRSVATLMTELSQTCSRVVAYLSALLNGATRDVVSMIRTLYDANTNMTRWADWSEALLRRSVTQSSLPTASEEEESLLESSWGTDTSASACCASLASSISIIVQCLDDVNVIDHKHRNPISNSASAIQTNSATATPRSGRTPPSARAGVLAVPAQQQRPTLCETVSSLIFACRITSSYASTMTPLERRSQQAKFKRESLGHLISAVASLLGSQMLCDEMGCLLHPPVGGGVSARTASVLAFQLEIFASAAASSAHGKDERSVGVLGLEKCVAFCGGSQRDYSLVAQSTAQFVFACLREVLKSITPQVAHFKSADVGSSLALFARLSALLRTFVPLTSADRVSAPPSAVAWMLECLNKLHSDGRSSADRTSLLAAHETMCNLLTASVFPRLNPADEIMSCKCCLDNAEYVEAVASALLAERRGQQGQASPSMAATLLTACQYLVQCEDTVLAFSVTNAGVSLIIHMLWGIAAAASCSTAAAAAQNTLASVADLKVADVLDLMDSVVSPDDNAKLLALIIAVFSHESTSAPDRKISPVLVDRLFSQMARCQIAYLPVCALLLRRLAASNALPAEEMEPNGAFLDVVVSALLTESGDSSGSAAAALLLAEDILFHASRYNHINKRIVQLMQSMSSEALDALSAASWASVAAAVGTRWSTAPASSHESKWWPRALSAAKSFSQSSMLFSNSLLSQDAIAELRRAFKNLLDNALIPTATEVEHMPKEPPATISPPPAAKEFAPHSNTSQRASTAPAVQPTVVGASSSEPVNSYTPSPVSKSPLYSSPSNQRADDGARGSSPVTFVNSGEGSPRNAMSSSLNAGDSDSFGGGAAGSRAVSGRQLLAFQQAAGGSSNGRHLAEELDTISKSLALKKYQLSEVNSALKIAGKELEETKTALDLDSRHLALIRKSIAEVDPDRFFSREELTRLKRNVGERSIAELDLASEANGLPPTYEALAAAQQAKRCMDILTDRFYRAMAAAVETNDHTKLREAAATLIAERQLFEKEKVFYARELELSADIIWKKHIKIHDLQEQVDRLARDSEMYARLQTEFKRLEHTCKELREMIDDRDKELIEPTTIEPKDFSHRLSVTRRATILQANHLLSTSADVTPTAASSRSASFLSFNAARGRSKNSFAAHPLKTSSPAKCRDSSKAALGSPNSEAIVVTLPSPSKQYEDETFEDLDDGSGAQATKSVEVLDSAVLSTSTKSSRPQTASRSRQHSDAATAKHPTNSSINMLHDAANTNNSQPVLVTEHEIEVRKLQFGLKTASTRIKRLQKEIQRLQVERNSAIVEAVDARQRTKFVELMHKSDIHGMAWAEQRMKRLEREKDMYVADSRRSFEELQRIRLESQEEVSTVKLQLQKVEEQRAQVVTTLALELDTARLRITELSGDSRRKDMVISQLTNKLDLLRGGGNSSKQQQGSVTHSSGGSPGAALTAHSPSKTSRSASAIPAAVSAGTGGVMASANRTSQMFANLSEEESAIDKRLDPHLHNFFAWKDMQRQRRMKQR